MVSSITMATGKRWILSLATILVMFMFIWMFHTDTSVMKQAVGKTVKKIKQFATVLTNRSNDGFLFLDPTTIAPVVDGSGKITKSDTNNHAAATSSLINGDEIIQRRFQEREDLRERVCKQSSYKSMSKEIDIKARFMGLGNGLVRLCRIPKVGTSYFKNMEQKLFRELGAKTKKAQSAPLEQKKILIVREPYSRLMSGYIGKIVTNPPWGKSLGSKMIKKFRPTASNNSKKCGHDVTFTEFLKYFVEADVTGWARDIHFIPMVKQCNPCAESYDYIGHLETIKDDMSFVLKSVNVTMDMDFNDEEFTMRGKANDIVSHKDNILKCESMCSALRKVWWSFSARGLISMDIQFPLSNDRCGTINGTEFADIAWDAHVQSTGRIDKAKQKREALVRLYLQVPLVDRLKVRDRLMKDFELYGYDSQPADIFPELLKES